MYKRIISVMLVMVMCLTLLPLPAAASGYIEAIYSDGVVAVVGTGFTSGTSYTIRVVDLVNSRIKAMGQVTADGNGNFSVSIITGLLEELENYIAYVNNPDGTLAGSALISALVPKQIEATYSGGVVEVVGTGFTSGNSYTVRVVDTVKLQIKAMRQVTADENGNISISITTGVLEELGKYVVFVNNLDGLLVASDDSIEEIPVLYTATIEAGTGGRIITGASGQYAAGDIITLEASADSGYVFSGWTSVGGGEFEDANSASTTFTMPAADVVITANFTYVGVEEGSIEATYSGGVVEVAGTGFTSGNSYTVRVVDTVKLQIKAMRQVTADENGNISISITTGLLEELEKYVVYVNNLNGLLVASDDSIEEIPVLYTATIQAGTGGKIVIGSSGQYAVGAIITLEASADSGYVFSGWTSVGGGEFEDANSASTTFTMPAADVVITANFTYVGVEEGSIEATYYDGVVEVVGTGFTSGTSYIVRVVDPVNSQIKAMGQATADENGNISISITTGLLEELDNYVVYVNNLDGLLVASDDSIEEIPVLYTATIEAGTGGRIVIGSSGQYAAGTIIILEASADSGYVFSGWTSVGGGEFEDASSASTTFTMPAADVVITANFTYVEGIVVPPPLVEEDKEMDDTTVESSEDGTALTATTTVKAEADDKGIAKAQLTEEDIAKAVDKVVEEVSKQQDKAKTVVEIKVEADEKEDVKGFDVELPKEGIDALAEGNIDTLKITTPVAEVSFDSKAVSAISASASESVLISVSSVDKADLKPEVQEVVGDRQVYDFTITSGDKVISDLGGGTATISIPYTPKAGEDLNAIVIYHITDEGELVLITDCVYDAETGTLTFKLSHFSKYAVGYNKVEFTDTEGSWAKDYITYLSARNIISGDGTGRYLPGNNITRAEFTKILAGIAGIDAAKYRGSAFQDVEENAWYAPYVAWAAEKGIVKGYGNGLFGPDDYITREQIALMITRFAAVQNYTLPEVAEAIEFGDSDKISSYAREAVEKVQRAGIINGRPSGDRIVFAPLDNADRAEAAKMLAILMQNMVK